MCVCVCVCVRVCVSYLTAFKTHECIRLTLISAWQIKKTKRSTNIKRDEIDTMNIINDNTFDLHNILLNNNNRNINFI